MFLGRRHRHPGGVVEASDVGTDRRSQHVSTIASRDASTRIRAGETRLPPLCRLPGRDLGGRLHEHVLRLPDRVHAPGRLRAAGRGRRLRRPGRGHLRVARAGDADDDLPLGLVRGRVARAERRHRHRSPAAARLPGVLAGAGPRPGRVSRALPGHPALPARRARLRRARPWEPARLGGVRRERDACRRDQLRVPVPVQPRGLLAPRLPRRGSPRHGRLDVPLGPDRSDRVLSRLARAARVGAPLRGDGAGADRDLARPRRRARVARPARAPGFFGPEPCCCWGGPCSPPG